MRRSPCAATRQNMDMLKIKQKISLVHAKWIQMRGDEKSAGMYYMSKNAINNREYKGQWIV